MFHCNTLRLRSIRPHLRNNLLRLLRMIRSFLRHFDINGCGSTPRNDAADAASPVVQAQNALIAVVGNDEENQWILNILVIISENEYLTWMIVVHFHRCSLHSNRAKRNASKGHAQVRW